MFGACIGHVSARTPALSAEVFGDGANASDRLARLIPALFDRHRMFAPWLRWSRHETHLLPDMAVYFTKMRERHLRLIQDALAPDFGPRPPRALVGLIETLTNFDAWQTLTVGNGLSSDEAAAAVADAAAAVAAAHPGRARSSLSRRATRRRASRPDLLD
jgi:hypothetical protein